MARGELGECAARMRRTRRVWARRVARGDGSRAAWVARVLGTDDEKGSAVRALLARAPGASADARAAAAREDAALRELRRHSETMYDDAAQHAASQGAEVVAGALVTFAAVRNIALDRISTRDHTVHAAAQVQALLADGTTPVVMRPPSPRRMLRCPKARRCIPAKWTAEWTATARAK